MHQPEVAGTRGKGTGARKPYLKEIADIRSFRYKIILPIFVFVQRMDENGRVSD